MDNSRDNPYVGPRTFTEEDAPFFFGREREARDLLALILTEQVVVFYAQSGTGKSSLLNTRIIPNLEKNKGFEVLPIGRVTSELPSDVPIDNIYVYSLMRNLVSREVEPDKLAKLTLREFLPRLVRDPESEKKGYIYLEDPSGQIEPQKRKRRILIVDQFEELFSTHPEEWECREDFFGQMAQAIEEDPSLWVLLVMREDYIAYIAPYAHLIPGGLRTRYYMQRMEFDDALKAVSLPVKNIRPYAKDVAERLVEDLCGKQTRRRGKQLEVVRGQYVEPIVLQTVCYTLWANLRDEGPEITFKNLEDRGDVNEALGEYYEKRVHAIAELSEVKDKGIKESEIRKWFGTQLINKDGKRSIVVRRSDMKSGGLDDGVIQIFRRFNDLVREEEHSGSSIYELTHDRLVEPILQNNATWEREHGFPFRQQVDAWNESTGKEVHLLSTEALAEAEQWAKEHPENLAISDIEFIEASKKLQTERGEKRSARRRRWITFASVAVAVFTLALAGVALFQSVKANEAAGEATRQKSIAEEASIQAQWSLLEARERTKEAQSRVLSSRAFNQLNNQPDLAMLLGIAAHQLNGNPESESTLLRILERSSDIERFLFLNPTSEVQINPNGKSIATLDEEGITLLDLAGQKQGSFPGLLSPTFSTAFSPDGSILAVGSKDGSILLWDTKTWQLLSKPLTAHTEWVNSVTFNREGTILASVSDDNSIILWDVQDRANPTIFGKPIDTGYNPNCAVFSPKQDYLATCNSSGEIVIWDVTDEMDPHRLYEESFGEQTRSVAANGLAYTPDAKILVSGSRDGTIFLWNMSSQTPTKIGNIQFSDGAGVYSVAVSPNGKLLAAGNSKGSVALWNISNPNKPRSLGDSLYKTLSEK